MLDPRIAEALVSVVRRAAKSEILPRFRAMGAEDIRAKSGPDDLVTAADLGAEAIITEAVSDILPEARFLGEEAAVGNPALLNEPGAPGWCVILDPVDGTWNFASGLSTFGVMLAVSFNGETQFGLLYDPVNDDWMTAHKGEGAWHNRRGAEPQRLQTRRPERLADMVGYVPLPMLPPQRQSKIAASFPSFRRILSLRCACHEYRTIAAGHTGFALSGSLWPWDHAAGVLLVQEAGGHVAMLDGRSYGPGVRDGTLLAAASREHWETVHAHFAPLL
ncbi:MAG: inositol monophosphatase [Celeribacter sp.]|jgi:fructose-1,6-bisphosphatase/inositol monophosphatase family enzyme